MILHFLPAFLQRNGESRHWGQRLEPVSGSPKTFSHSLGMEPTPLSGEQDRGVFES
jgi:hypothetical protein